MGAELFSFVYIKKKKQGPDSIPFPPELFVSRLEVDSCFRPRSQFPASLLELVVSRLPGIENLIPMALDVALGNSWESSNSHGMGIA